MMQLWWSPDTGKAVSGAWPEPDLHKHDEYLCSDGDCETHRRGTVGQIRRTHALEIFHAMVMDGVDPKLADTLTECWRRNQQ